MVYDKECSEEEEEEMTILSDLRHLKRLHNRRAYGECFYCSTLIDILIRKEIDNGNANVGRHRKIVKHGSCDPGNHSVYKETST